MANKGLNIFGECAAKFVHHVPPEEHCSSCGDVNVHTWYHSKFTEDAKKNWCYWQSNNFSRKIDTVSHLKAFKNFFNEMLVLLIILCCYFSFLQMYSDKS